MRQNLLDLIVGVTKNPALYGRLLGYAYKLIRPLPWSSETDLRELAQDVVSQAICDTITCKRKWNPTDDAEPAPMRHLVGAIHSIVSNRFTKLVNQTHHDSLDAMLPDQTASPTPLPDTVVQAGDFFAGLMLEVDGDEVCEKMVDFFDRGYKPTEIAAELRMAPSEIYAANKRLKRKTESYIQKLNQVDS